MSLGLCARKNTVFENLTLFVCHDRIFKDRPKIFYTPIVQTIDFIFMWFWGCFAEVKLWLTARQKSWYSGQIICNLEVWLQIVDMPDGLNWSLRFRIRRKEGRFLTIRGHNEANKIVALIWSVSPNVKYLWGWYLLTIYFRGRGIFCRGQIVANRLFEEVNVANKVIFLYTVQHKELLS